MPKRLNLDVNKIKNLYINKSKSIREISRILNVNYSLIRKKLKELNIEIRPKKLDLDENKIKELYLNQRKSATKIGKIMGVSFVTIVKRLKEGGIKIRTQSEEIGIKLPLEKIKDLYLNQKKTGVEIAKILNVNYALIYKRLESLGIERRRKIPLDLNKIKELYLNEKKSPSEIGKIFGVSECLIISRLKENNIPIRGKRESHKGKHISPRTEFKKGDPRITGKNNLNYGGEKIKGEKNPNWQGGISFEPYGKEFNLELKEKIRTRDNYTCQECEKKQEELNRLLDVHHIDYNKKNNSSLNLISLCIKCHSKTNRNRKHWKRYLQMKIFIKEFFNPENLLVFENKQLIGMGRIG